MTKKEKRMQMFKTMLKNNKTTKEDFDKFTHILWNCVPISYLEQNADLLNDIINIYYNWEEIFNDDISNGS